MNENYKFFNSYDLPIPIQPAHGFPLTQINKNNIAQEKGKESQTAIPFLS